MPLAQVLNQPDFLSRPLGNQLKELLDSFAARMKNAGIQCVAYGDPALKVLNALTPERQRAVLSHFMIYYKILASAELDQVELNDNLMLTWWALKELRMKPGSRAFNHLDKTDVIEIYDNQGVQIYRTLNFYRLTTYSMEEMLCIPWYELFQRDERVTAQLMGWMDKIFKREIDFIVNPEVEDHVVREIRNLDFEPRLVRCKFIARLEGPVGLPGFLHAFQVLDTQPLI
jgi:hypothetical protein